MLDNGLPSERQQQLLRSHPPGATRCQDDCTNHDCSSKSWFIAETSSVIERKVVRKSDQPYVVRRQHGLKTRVTRMSDLFSPRRTRGGELNRHLANAFAGCLENGVGD